MISSLQITKGLGFRQCRFFVAVVLLVASLLKMYQLSTTPLLPVVQNSIFTPLLEFMNNRSLLVVFTIGELLFAFVLLSGVWIRQTCLLSMICFSVFTIISVMKGLSGEESCGCFGVLTVNPWITSAFDLFVLTTIFVFREQNLLSFDFKFSVGDIRKLSFAIAAWLILSIPAFYAMLSLKIEPDEILGSVIIQANGAKKIRLAPEKWRRKQFPLFDRVKPPVSDDWKNGKLSVVVVHSDCPKCLKLISQLDKQTIENVVILVVPSRGKTKPLQTSFNQYVLDPQVDWFAITPIVVQLENGICKSVGDSFE
jgi:hypothetical protein